MDNQKVPCEECLERAEVIARAGRELIFLASDLTNGRVRWRLMAKARFFAAIMKAVLASTHG